MRMKCSLGVDPHSVCVCDLIVLTESYDVIKSNICRPYVWSESVNMCVNILLFYFSMFKSYLWLIGSAYDWN